jgi:hypothetical protein
MSRLSEEEKNLLEHAFQPYYAAVAKLCFAEHYMELYDYNGCLENLWQCLKVYRMAVDMLTACRGFKVDEKWMQIRGKVYEECTLMRTAVEKDGHDYKEYTNRVAGAYPSIWKELIDSLE